MKMWRKKTLRGGHQIFIHESPGSKGTIIGVHGLTGHHMQLGHFQKAFERQYRMITYDLRGRGKSSKAYVDHSIDCHVDDLIDLIHSLNINRPILMGYSMGAYICLKAAARIDDIAAVILLDGAGQTDEGQLELVLPSLNRLRNQYLSRLDYIEQTRERYEKLGIRWSEHMNRITNYEIEKQGDFWVHKSEPKLVEKEFISIFEFEVEQYAKEIEAPVLLIKASGYMGHRPFFYNDQFDQLQQFVKHIHTVKTKTNHLALVYNRQIELEWKILNFLDGALSKQENQSSASPKY